MTGNDVCNVLSIDPNGAINDPIARILLAYCVELANKLGGPTLPAPDQTITDAEEEI